MRAREFLKPQVSEERTDEFIQALAPVAIGVGRAAVAGAQMIGRGAVTAGRMAANAGGKIAGAAGKVATSGIQKVGQAGVRQLGKDIGNSLRGKSVQIDPNKQQAQMMSGDQIAQIQQSIQQANPNITAGQLGNLVGQYKQGKVDATGSPVEDETALKPGVSNSINAPSKNLDPKTNQTMTAAEKTALPPGSTIPNDKLGPLQVQPMDPTIPDKEKGVTVKVKNDPTLPKFTIKNKDLAQGNQQIQKDLGGSTT